MYTDYNAEREIEREREREREREKEDGRDSDATIGRAFLLARNGLDGM